MSQRHQRSLKALALNSAEVCAAAWRYGTHLSASHTDADDNISFCQPLTNADAYGLDYNETTIRSNAASLVSLGFRDLGYDVVIFDDAMTERQRSANGSLLENAEKFPSGLRVLSDELHELGLKYGVYSSAGAYTCGSYPGGLGHEDDDARFWADLGADYLKYDNCHNEGQAGTQEVSYRRYKAMSDALGATGRNITYSLCGEFVLCVCLPLFR